MEKRYQVFLSSTFLDLVAERRLILDTLIGHKCFPVGMENFPSLTINSLPYIYNLIDESDFFLLILNGVYGSSRDENGKSFTHLEWLHAIEKKKPIIVLYREDWEKHTKIKEYPDDATAFSKFFKDVKEMHDGAKPWTNETLAVRVIEGIDQAINDHPEAVGWIRANTPGCSLNAQSNTSLEEIADRLQHPIKVQSNIIFTKASNGSANSLPECLACTYEEIFLSFAKKFFNSRVGESLCIESICNMLQEKYKIEIEERLKNLGNFVLLNIDPDEIDNIRLEFATNKLVDITSNGKFFVWRLSEFGLQYLKLLHERSFYGA